MKLHVAIALSLFLAASAGAQLTVELRLDQQQYLIGEEIPVKTLIGNMSGQTALFGDTDDWLVFNLESREGRQVTKLSEPPVRLEFQLETSTVGTRRVNIQPHFSLDQPGRYQISATVRARQWGRDWTTKPVFFNLTPGNKVWESDFGVPGTPGPEMRKYALIQAHLTKQLRLYFRLSDPTEANVMGVVPIGNLVSFSKPEVQLGKGNNCHVFYQNGARTFTYVVFNPDGKLLKRQTFEMTNTRPRLGVDPDGDVLVTGGIRRQMQDDMPPAPKDEPAPLLPVPTPEPTAPK